MLAPLGPIMEGQMGKVTAIQKDTLETIRRNGFRLLKLINNLLDLTKLEDGKMRLKIKTVDFIDFTSSLLSPPSSRWPTSKKIRLYFQHPPHDVDLTIDPDQFEKVILNLLSNALKFTPRGGKITRLYRRARNARHPDRRGHGHRHSRRTCWKAIFDRFSQVDGSMSRPHEGTGIGLSLAREIVNLHRRDDPGRKRTRERLAVHRGLQKGEGHFSEEVLDRRHKDQPVGLQEAGDRHRGAPASRISSRTTAGSSSSISNGSTFEAGRRRTRPRPTTPCSSSSTTTPRSSS